MAPVTRRAWRPLDTLRTINASRKGLLATVITILMALPILLLVLTTTDFIRQTQTSFAVTEAGPRMAFYTQDVIHDHADIIGWTVSGTNGQRWINFSGIGTLNDGWRSRFDEYGLFLAHKYSPVLNLVINISGTPLPANITPVGYTISSAGDVLVAPASAGGEPWRNLSAINVRITLNQSGANISGNSTPANNGAVAMSTTLIGIDNEELFVWPAAALDPATANTPFSATFMDGSSVQVTFGSINGTEGSLLISARRLEANVTNLGLRFALNGTPGLETGSNVFIAAPGAINKTAKIIVTQHPQ